MTGGRGHITRSVYVRILIKCGGHVDDASAVSVRVLQINFDVLQHKSLNQCKDA